MSSDKQDDYAIKAGTTGAYLRTHVLVPIKRRKIPRPDLIERLVEATNGKVSKAELLNFLYDEDINKSAA